MRNHVTLCSQRTARQLNKRGTFQTFPPQIVKRRLLVFFIRFGLDVAISVRKVIGLSSIISCTCTGLYNRDGSSRRAAGLQPSLKNLRQKIPPNGQTRLKFGFSYENLTTQSFSVLPTVVWLNVS